MTVTDAVAVPKLPAASVALNVTTVSPSGKTAGPSLVTGNVPSTLSTAEAPARKAAIASEPLTATTLANLYCQT